MSCARLTAMALLLAVPTAARAEAEFRVLVTGDGFRDTTPARPIGGNPGTTLGEQRRLALEHATEVWGEQLDSDVPIQVRASFSALGCEPRGAVLGQATARRVLCGDELGTDGAAQCHVGALADRLAGRDLVPGEADIEIEFNLSLDGACGAKLGGAWYYGFEQGAGAQNDFVEIALHELAHGLGFSAFVDLETGELELLQVDSFSAHIRDLDLDQTWADMTDDQRAASATNPGRVVWDGPATQRAALLLLAADPRAMRQGGPPYRGADARGRPLLYTPATLELGSSVSHFDRSAMPDLLMEPSYNGFPQHQLDLTLPVLHDMGWSSLCGNGRIDRAEQCDEGEANDDATADRCRKTCERPRCGDGVVDLAEVCDQGAANSDARAGACRSDCRPARCGDGVLDANESCDEGPANSDVRPNACRNDCRRPRCGDGIVDANETCDGPDGCTLGCVPAKTNDGFGPWTVTPTERPRASQGCTASRQASAAQTGNVPPALALLGVLALLVSGRKK